MTALSAMQAAAVRLVGKKPSTFFASQNKFEEELVDLINEVAADIVQSHAWQALLSIHTITGDGTETDFALPADYAYMPIGGGIQDPTNWFWGYRNILDVNEWIEATSHDFQGYPGGWIIFGGEMHFSPAPGSGSTAAFPYVSKFSVIAKDGSHAETFTNDEDTFKLPERLLTLGLVWRWNEQKFGSAPSDEANYQKALSEYAGRDRGSVVIRKNIAPSFHNSVRAWPWELG